jgi:hypothetical protein
MGGASLTLRKILAGGVLAFAAAAAPAKAEWAGGYIGGHTALVAAGTDFVPGGGIHAGYLLSNQGTVCGMEGALGLSTNTGAVFGDVSVVGTFGRVLGGKALVYAVAGGGAWFSIGGGQLYYVFGGGIEFPLGLNGMTMSIEPRAFGLSTTGCCAIQVKLGLNWRP